MQHRLTTEITHFLSELPEEERIAAINEFRMAIHSVSPFRDEPVDCVLWVKNDHISPNDYNPNNVAPPEKKLLLKSIEQDGFTQPIVVVKADAEEYEIVDGFHRHELGKGKAALKRRLKGYLPITCLDRERHERMAATIRHNRARASPDPRHVRNRARTFSARLGREQNRPRVRYGRR